jgi:hypothetical protein
MSYLEGKFQWAWNCGSKNDIDVFYLWGDKGTLTIQRQYLRKIIYRWRFCNQRDGWIEESRTFELPQPTSDPYTFPIEVAFHNHLGVNMADQYWGRKYKVETMLYILSGYDEIILDEEYPNTTTGRFRRGDPNYNPAEWQKDCNPPDEPGENGSTVCD